jgi:hypothetical protein
MTTPERKSRCLRLVEHTNGIKLRGTDQCASERLPGSALCSHHLGEAASEFRRLTGQDDGGEIDVPGWVNPERPGGELTAVPFEESA